MRLAGLLTTTIALAAIAYPDPGTEAKHASRERVTSSARDVIDDIARILDSTRVLALGERHGWQEGRQSFPPALEQGTLPANWYAGGADCAGKPPLHVQAYNADFFIMRQAACTNYEKPFLYLLFGRDKALLLDTGAGRIDVAATVDTLVRGWLARNGRTSLDLIVAHSHAHGDHVAGDSQFVGRPHTTLVGRDTASVRAFFGIRRWPNDSGMADLGGRVLDVLAIPGHQAASIAVYDRRTGTLLTGDTFYPGRLYVRDTTAFAESIDRLTAFVRTHRVTHMLGAHIENSRTPYVDYVVGTVDQPEEHELDLGRTQLFELDSVVRSMRGRMVRTVLRDLTLWPVER
jgi:glyoxylase-like metal-dependent hydrolase (beta-lactamase superfamily II)